MPDFVYEGDVTLRVTPLQDVPVVLGGPKPIKVRKISHLLPINCHCTVGDDEMILTAYIDYSTRKIEVPTYTLGLLGDRTDTFELAIHDFLESQDHEVSRRHEEEFAATTETPSDVRPRTRTVN